jgi:hypothetical protein
MAVAFLEITAAGKPIYKGFRLKRPYPSIISEVGPQFHFSPQSLSSIVPTIDRRASSTLLRVIAKAQRPFRRHPDNVNYEGGGTGGIIRIMRCWKKVAADRDMLDATGGATDDNHLRLWLLPPTSKGRGRLCWEYRCDERSGIYLGRGCAWMESGPSTT